MTPLARLEDVCDINPRLSKKPHLRDRVSFLGMADVSESGTTSAGHERYYEEVQKGFTNFSNGDLLVAKITPCFQNGKIAEAAIEHDHGFGSTEFHVVRPKADELDRRYLLHFLRLPSLRVDGERRMTGSGGQRRVPTEFLRDLKVPLPPLPDQRRIAAILDHADALRTRRRESLIRLSELTQSIFTEKFGALDAFDCVPLSTLASISSGVTKGRRVPDGVPTRSVPYMAVVNVQDKRLDLSVVKSIEVTATEVQKFQLKKNDLLLTEGGDPDKLGRGCLWDDQLAEAIHQNHIFRVRITEAQLRPAYLNWLVGSQYGKRYFLKSAKQTTGIASINSSQLKLFPTVLPPVHLQIEFEEELLRCLNTSNKQVQSGTELDRVVASLQSRAFRGAL